MAHDREGGPVVQAKHLVARRLPRNQPPELRITASCSTHFVGTSTRTRHWGHLKNSCQDHSPAYGALLARLASPASLFQGKYQLL